MSFKDVKHQHTLEQIIVNETRLPIPLWETLSAISGEFPKACRPVLTHNRLTSYFLWDRFRQHRQASGTVNKCKLRRQLRRYCNADKWLSLAHWYMGDGPHRLIRKRYVGIPNSGIVVILQICYFLAMLAIRRKEAEGKCCMKPRLSLCFYTK